LAPVAWPPLVRAALALPTFSLPRLGALGERNASIAQATVTLAIYNMIGLEQHGADDRAQAISDVSHLLACDLWYGQLNIQWTALFAYRPVRELLARI
ncbi:FUSC family membrane protein, partial [Stenotrophomonas sp. SrG]|uniref:FUSC family membrane protein n=1 Tax=Stenotrophomonas sp. SrG TaxID=3414430 RepID=UPI003CE7BB62